MMISFVIFNVTIFRLFWIIVVSASIAFATISILNTYYKWMTSPVIVSFHQKSTPIWNIPFPAVTICPETVIKQSIINISEIMLDLKMNDSVRLTPEFQLFENVSIVCRSDLIEKKERTTTMHFLKNLEQVSPTLDETIMNFFWGNKNFDPSRPLLPLSRVLTEDGICHTFNMLNGKEFFTDQLSSDSGFETSGVESKGWSLENGYPDNNSERTIPARAFGAGIDSGITIFLSVDLSEQDYYCREANAGFKIILHHPADLPISTGRYVRVPLQQEVILAIKPEMMTTSEGLRHYNPSGRSCYFSDEKYLRFYKTYTQQNCEMECLTNFTYNSCHCVAYYMPHAENTPICAGDYKCLEKAKKNYRLFQVQKEMKEYERRKSGSDLCRCLPACTSISYNSEVTQADFSFDKYLQMLNDSLDESIKISKVSIYYAENQFIGSVRNELYGITNFIANCGGLLGLFMGFSLLSLVEVFYFFVRVLFCKVRELKSVIGTPDKTA